MKLYLGTKFSGSLEQDTKYPTMWRIRQGEKLSDMVNLVRAKDAAISWARPRGLGGSEVVHWKPSAKAASEGAGELIREAATPIAPGPTNEPAGPF
jgi:hypothetical protein